MQVCCVREVADIAADVLQLAAIIIRGCNLLCAKLLRHVLLSDIW